MNVERREVQENCYKMVKTFALGQNIMSRIFQLYNLKSKKPRLEIIARFFIKI